MARFSLVTLPYVMFIGKLDADVPLEILQRTHMSS